jgi:hypothetical protein
MTVYDSSLSLWTKSIGNGTFPVMIQNNSGRANGGFIEAYNSLITMDQYYYFKSNSALFGGAFHIRKTSSTLIGDMTVFMTKRLIHLIIM